MVEWDPLLEEELGSSLLESYTLAITDVEGTGLETEVLVSAQATAHAFDSLIPGQAYTFRIKATNLVGDSEWSDSTQPLYPGVEPTRPGLITFTSTTRTTITFTFSELTGQDTGGTEANPIPLTYHIYISKDGGTSYGLLISTTDALAKTASYLSPGLMHYFKYQAENDIGLLSELSTAYEMMPG